MIRYFTHKFTTLTKCYVVANAEVKTTHRIKQKNTFVAHGWLIKIISIIRQILVINLYRYFNKAFTLTACMADSQMLCNVENTAETTSNM